MLKQFSPLETLMPLIIPICVNGVGRYSYINLKIAVAPTADMAIGINIIDLKNDSPLFNLSVSQANTKPMNTVKKTTKISQST